MTNQELSISKLKKSCCDFWAVFFLDSRAAFVRRFDCIKNIGHNFVNARVLRTIPSTFELDVEPR